MTPYSFLKFGRPAVRIQTMKCSIKLRHELTVFNIQPLYWLPLSSLVLEFKLNVTLPSNVRIVYRDVWRNVVVRLRVELEGIIKDRLSNQAAGYSHCALVQSCDAVKSDWYTHICVRHNGVAFGRRRRQVNHQSHELVVAARFDIASMILIEVSKFVVNINGCSYSTAKCDCLVAF